MTTLFTASLGNAPQPFFLQWGQSSFLCVLRHGSKKAWDSNLSATSVRPKKRHPNVTAVSKIPSGSKKAWDSNLSAISVEGVRPKKRHPNVIAVSKIPSKIQIHQMECRWGGGGEICKIQTRRRWLRLHLISTKTHYCGQSPNTS